MLKNFLKKLPFYKLYANYQRKKYIKHIQELSENFHREGETVLKDFAQILNEHSIPFWLDYGTLLGYHREHDFIGHDTDIDTGVFIEDAERVKQALEKNGFKLVRRYYNVDGSGMEHCYCKKGFKTTIDVFFYERDNDSVTCYSYYPLPNIDINKNLYKEIPFTTYACTMPFCGLKKTTFKAIEVYVPIDIEGYLIANYGPNYMIPDPNYSSSSATNIKKFTYEEKPAVGYLEIPY